MSNALNKSIADCQGLQMSPAGRAYKALLENAIDDWTKTLVETNDDTESYMLKGAIRKVSYLLGRVEEKTTK